MPKVAVNAGLRQSAAVSRRFLTDGGAELALTQQEAATVLQAGPSAMRTLGLSLALKAPSGGELQGVPVLRSSNIVGAARFTSDDQVVELTVGPKIGNANVLQMMDFVGEQMVPTEDAIALSSTRGHPAALVIEYIAREVRRFTEGPSFRDYVRVRDASARQPRGRLDAERFVIWNWPRMQWHSLPCAYFNFTQDVPENQLLAAAIETASRLSVLLPQSARTRVRDHVFYARRRLAGVEPPRRPERLLESIAYHRNNEHFQQIHRLCGVLLNRSTLTFEQAMPVSFCAFAIDMALLFEKYIRRLFRLAFGLTGVPSKEELVFPLGGSSHHIKLDGMHLGSTRRVIECKYRMVEDASTLSFDEGELPNAHLFQAVAYAVHEKVDAEEALLIYPAIDLGRPLEEKLTVSGFRTTSGAPLRLRVLLVSLAHPATAIAEALTKQFRR